MPLPSLIDEIDRLFNEMVRARWRREPAAAGAMRPAEAAHFEVEIPLTGGERGDVLVALEGHQLIVGWSCRVRRSGVGGVAADATATEQEQFKRTFVLPEDADVGAIEARFEGNVLRVRVGLRPARR